MWWKQYRLAWNSILLALSIWVHRYTTFPHKNLVSFLDPFCFKYTPRLIRPCLMGKILVVSGLENVANAYRFTKFQRNRSKLLCSWRGRKTFGFRVLTTPSTHRGSPSFYHHLPIETLTQQPKPVPIIIALATNHHFLIFPLRNPNFSSAVSIFSCHQCKGKDLNSLES